MVVCVVRLGFGFWLLNVSFEFMIWVCGELVFCDLWLVGLGLCWGGLVGWLLCLGCVWIWWVGCLSFGLFILVWWVGLVWGLRLRLCFELVSVLLCSLSGTSMFWV